MDRDSYSHNPRNPMPRDFGGPDSDDSRVVMQTVRNTYLTHDNEPGDRVAAAEGDDVD